MQLKCTSDEFLVNFKDLSGRIDKNLYRNAELMLVYYHLSLVFEILVLIKACLRNLRIYK